VYDLLWGQGCRAIIDDSICASNLIIIVNSCAANGGFGNRVKGLTNVLAACIARRSICAFRWDDPHPLRSAFDSAAMAALDWRVVNATFRGSPNPSHFEACLSHSRDVEDAFNSQFEWMTVDRSLRPPVIQPFRQPQQWFLSYPCAEHHFGWSAYPHSLQSATLSLLSLISVSVNSHWRKHWGNTHPDPSTDATNPIIDMEQLHAVLLSAIFSPSTALELQQHLFQADQSVNPAPGIRNKTKLIAVCCAPMCCRRALMLCRFTSERVAAISTRQARASAVMMRSFAQAVFACCQVNLALYFNQPVIDCRTGSSHSRHRSLSAD
jgi:hypothetical protein